MRSESFQHVLLSLPKQTAWEAYTSRMSDVISLFHINREENPSQVSPCGNDKSCALLGSPASRRFWAHPDWRCKAHERCHLKATTKYTHNHHERLHTVIGQTCPLTWKNAKAWFQRKLPEVFSVVSISFRKQKYRIQSATATLQNIRRLKLKHSKDSSVGKHFLCRKRLNCCYPCFKPNIEHRIDQFQIDGYTERSGNQETISYHVHPGHSHFLSEMMLRSHRPKKISADLPISRFPQPHCCCSNSELKRRAWCGRKELCKFWRAPSNPSNFLSYILCGKCTCLEHVSLYISFYLSIYLFVIICLCIYSFYMFHRCMATPFEGPSDSCSPKLLSTSALSSCLMEGTGTRILRVRRLTDAACGHEQNASPANLLNLLPPISV